MEKVRYHRERREGGSISFFFSLSTMDSQSQLMDYGKELLPPEKWKESKGSQLVNLNPTPSTSQNCQDR
jgi:hypothetical protein